MTIGSFKGKNYTGYLFLVVLFLGAVLSNTTSKGAGINSVLYDATDNILPNNNFEASLEEIGQYKDRYGTPLDVTVRDDLAFVASSYAGLLIFNISNPNEPELVSTFDTEHSYSDIIEVQELYFTRGVQLIGDIAAVADGDNGLVLVNISNPEKPSFLGKHECTAFYFAVTDFYVYLVVQGEAKSNYGNVLQVLDIHDPTKPTLLTEINNTQTGGFFFEPLIVGCNLFVYAPPGFFVYDISNPSELVEITRLESSTGKYLQKTENFLLAANLTHLSVVDISEASNLTVILDIQTDVRSISDMAVLNETIYLTDVRSPKITTIDISDVENVTITTQLISQLSPWYDGKRITAFSRNNQKFLCCVDSLEGLLICNITNKTDIATLGYFNTKGFAENLVIVGDFAYMTSRRDNARFPSRLEIISVADPTNPALIGQYFCDNCTILDIKVSGDYAYLSIAEEGLRIVDVSNPLEPVLVGKYFYSQAVGYFGDLWFDNSTSICYLTHRYYDLFIIDCSNPEKPVFLQAFDVTEPFYLTSIYLKEDILYLMSNNEWGDFAILNVSDPLNPVLLCRSFVDDYISGIAIQDNIAYLSGRYDLLMMMDISDPADPQWITSLKTWLFLSKDLTVAGKYAFVAQYLWGLRVVDVSNPGDPVEIAAVRDHYAGLCYDVVVHEGLIYIADGWDGLEVYNLSIPAPQTNGLSRTAKILLGTLVPTGVILATVPVVVAHKLRKKRQ